MLVPNKVFHAHTFAAKDPTRFLLNGLFFERDKIYGTKIHACATDGKKLIHVRFDEPPVDEFPDVDGVSTDCAVNMAGTIIHADTCKAVLKNQNKKPIKPILGNVLLDENRREKVNITIVDHDGNQSIEGWPIAGKFPDYRSIFKSTEYPEELSVRVNPRILRDAADALEKMSGEKLSPILLMSFARSKKTKKLQVDADKPIRLRLKTPELEADAYIMPLVIDKKSEKGN